MKQLLVVLMLGVAMFSCSDDKSDDDAVESSYKIYLDDVLLSEYSAGEGAVLMNGLLSFGNSDDCTIMMYNVPAVGKTVDLSLENWQKDNETNTMVEMLGSAFSAFPLNKASFFSGTLTRVSENKVEFEGIVKEQLISGTSHTCKGEVVFSEIIGY